MAFEYYNQRLCLAAKGNFIDIKQLAESYEGKVLYIYDQEDVRSRLERIKNSFSGQVDIHYAMKANHNREILKAVKNSGCGVDIVSGGELNWALDCGFTADEIVFSGVGKTSTEIQLAVEKQIKQINVESPQELERIGRIALELGKTANVAFRMNPDVDADTHPYIKTGFRDNKFGMDESFLPALLEILSRYKKQLNLRGLTLHIGSQIKNTQSIFDAIKKTLPLIHHLRQLGYNLETFDIGGGLGVDYESSNTEEELNRVDEFGPRVLSVLKDQKLRILVEPGRAVVARAGILIGEVQYIKKTPFKNFAILNTGMHHLMRPCLYEAFHRIEPVVQDLNTNKLLYDIVGPICESSDVVGFDRSLPVLNQGDLLAIFDVGAYGYVMSNSYNMHESPIELVL